MVPASEPVRVRVTVIENAGSCSSLLEPSSNVFDTSFEMDLVGFPVRKPSFPLAGFFGALHPSEVINSRPLKPDRRPVDGRRHGAVLGLEKKFRFPALSIRHNDTALLMNNTE